MSAESQFGRSSPTVLREITPSANKLSDRRIGTMRCFEKDVLLGAHDLLAAGVLGLQTETNFGISPFL